MYLDFLRHFKVEQMNWPDGMRVAGLELELGKYCCLKSETRSSPAGGGGFNRYAHSAGPILVMRDQGNND